MDGNEGYVDFRDHKTWYSTYGNIHGDQTPLLVLHGGPGYPHHWLQNLSLLSERGIPVVFYDQLGCGKSDRPDNPSLWTIELFVDELAAVRAALQLERVNLLGHSWGGSLALEYLFTQPVGVEKLILSSPLVDSELWVSENDKLKDQLPPEIAQVMRKHENAGTTDSTEYQDATQLFNRHFLCRLDPKPDDIRQCEDEGNSQVYETMWGPSEAHATGILKGWSALSRLGQITLQTLLISGKYDEATPAQMKIVKDSIPHAQWVLLENSSHAANYEEPDKYLATVEQFLKN